MQTVVAQLFSATQQKWRRAQKLGAIDAEGYMTLCGHGYAVRAKVNKRSIELFYQFSPEPRGKSVILHPDYAESSTGERLLDNELSEVKQVVECEVEIAPVPKTLYGFVSENVIFGIMRVDTAFFNNILTVELFLLHRPNPLPGYLSQKSVPIFLGAFWKLLDNSRRVIRLPEAQIAMATIVTQGYQKWYEFSGTNTIQPEVQLGVPYRQWNIYSALFG